jgi:hypothetical protein
MKRLYSDIDATAASLYNYSRVFSPYDDQSNLGGYQSLIYAHSQAQPSQPEAWNPVDYDAGSMAEAVSSSQESNARITPPGRVYASFTLGKFGTYAFPAPRQYSFAFYLRTEPVQSKSVVRESRTQRIYNASSAGEEIAPLYAVDPYYKNMLSALLQHYAANTDYMAYSEVTPDILYRGHAFGGDTDTQVNNPYYKLFEQLDILRQFKGWCAMDGCVMNNETYNGKQPLLNSIGNSIFNGLEPVIDSYHQMDMCMKGVYKMFNYWGTAGMQVGASLYLVDRKYAEDKYRHHRNDPGMDQGFLQWCVRRFDGVGYNESSELLMDMKVSNRNQQPRFEDTELPPYIRPSLMSAVAIANGGPLPREYLKFTDEEGRTRYGHHIYVGKLMRESWFARPRTDQLKPDQLTPLMDMRDVSTKETIHVLLDPDDCFHTVV